MSRKSNFFLFLKYHFTPFCSHVGTYAHRSLRELSEVLSLDVRPEMVMVLLLKVWRSPWPTGVLVAVWRRVILVLRLLVVIV